MSISNDGLIVFTETKAPEQYNDLLSCQSLKLGPFVGKYGRGALDVIVSGTLSEIADLMRFPVTAPQISFAAELIITDFPDTKLSDFKLFKMEMMRGNIGGGKDHVLYGWDARSIYDCWKQYYANREELFCEDREQKHREDKSAYENGLGKAFASASDKAKTGIEESLKRLAIKKAEDSIKPTFTGKMSLDEIAESQGLDKTELAEAILEANRTEYADTNDGSITFENFCIFKASVHLYEARNNPNYLKSFLS